MPSDTNAARTEYFVYDRTVWRTTGDVSQLQKNAFGEWPTDVIGGVPDPVEKVRKEQRAQPGVDYFTKLVIKAVTRGAGEQTAEIVRGARETLDVLNRDRSMLCVPDNKPLCFCRLFSLKRKNNVHPGADVTISAPLPR